jgi:hypothetical protein
VAKFKVFFVVTEYKDYAEESTIVIADNSDQAARIFKSETPEGYITDIVMLNY